MLKKTLILLISLYNVSSFTNLFIFNPRYTRQPKSKICMVSKFDDFNWKKNWIPIAIEKYTTKKKPFEFILLGEEIVVWWNNIEHKWCASENSCSHRLAPLSEGRVNRKGNIECPYHGWCFNSNGNCVKIPHRKNNIIESKFNINSYHVITKQGIIWVWGDKKSSEIPNVNKIPISPLIKGETVDFSLDLSYDYSLLLENIMDFSHVPYAHHNNQGNRYKSNKYFKYNIIENVNSYGFKLKNINGVTGNNTIFKAPFYTHTDFNFKFLSKINLFLIVYAIPKAPGYSRLIIRLDSSSQNNFLNFLCKKIQFFKPTFIRHMGRNEVLEEDSIFLHKLQNKLLSKNTNYYNYKNTLNDFNIASGADTPSVLFRKWLDKAGPIPWGNNSILKYYNKNIEIINREESHLKHCTACQKAYKNLELIKKVIVYIKPLIFIILWPLLNYYYPTNTYINRLISFTFLILTSVIWYICSQLQFKMKVGKYPPRRNLPN